MLGTLRLERLFGDVRYALRTLRNNLGFTCVAVLTLALGIGANTAIFTLIDSLLLRSLPVPQPQELVRIRSVGRRGQSDNFSYAIVNAFSERKNIFSGVAGFNRTTFNVGQPGSLTRVNGAWVTGEYYTTLGIHPALGRLLGRRAAADRTRERAATQPRQFLAHRARTAGPGALDRGCGRAARS